MDERKSSKDDVILFCRGMKQAEALHLFCPVYIPTPLLLRFACALLKPYRVVGERRAQAYLILCSMYDMRYAL